MTRIYVQYGCGNSSPDEWMNFDASPTLRIQRIPLVGRVMRNQLNLVFSPNVLYGDIIKGLPIGENQCDGIYCSHVLEHLSLTDARIALINTYKILKYGGIFRCVVPDLEFYAREYIHSFDNDDRSASLRFMGENTRLGREERPKGFKGLVSSFWGNSNHLWMWDAKSLLVELQNAGFIGIRVCKFNDCADEMFRFVEEKVRFEKAVALECKK